MEQNDNNNVYAPPTARVADPEPEQLAVRPRQVVIAVWLLCASFALGYLNQYLIVPITTNTQVRSARSIIVGTILFSGLAIWICRKILQGRNWMRIVFLVFFAIGLAITPFQASLMFHGSTELMTVYSIQSFLQAIFLWLVFTKPGSDWFRKRND